MAESYDVIVAGLGAMGSATAYHLARRGRRVLGLDRYHPGHAFGSSHGESRIIREVYFEHPLFVPIVRRAYELWEDLERETGGELMRITGGLTIGSPEGTMVSGARRSAGVHGIAQDVLTATDLAARFPAFRLREGDTALWDARAGYLRPEACIDAHLSRAAAAGATLRFGEAVTAWQPDGSGVRVVTPGGTYRAGQLVIASGAWARTLLPDLAVPLAVERQVLVWFTPGTHPEWYDPGRCPIYLWEFAPGRLAYGFPELGLGVKAAIYHEGETVDDPDHVRRSVSREEVEGVRGALRAVLPSLAGEPVRASATCLFTNTPDEYFLVDFHPNHSQVLISSPCSGHGFKFASAIGELQADLLLEGQSRFDISAFRYDRFSAQADGT